MLSKGINFWAFTKDIGGEQADPRTAISYAAELGYDSFEPTVDSEEGLLSLASTEQQVRQVVRTAQQAGIAMPTLASGLAWKISPTSPEKAVRQKAVQNTEKLLHIAAWLGAKTLLYIPGMVSASFIPDFEPQPYAKVEQYAKEAVAQLLPTAERLGIRIAVENVWNRFLLSPTEMCAFIDYFSSPWVGAYFDVGNCMLYGHPEDWATVLGSRIFAVHLKDFRVSVGNLDGFVDLLAGDVDVVGVIKTLTDIGYNNAYTIEYVLPSLGSVEKGIAALRVVERQLQI
jgi:hexulose-6-phosphate isomerase